MSTNTVMPSIPDTPGPESLSPPKKIPRPPNSFMIYRREQATKHTGLIAAKLSTKLAKAWRNETPETRAHYAGLAEQARAEHTLKYPTYKFTPARRGTGKRAKAIAATNGSSWSTRPKSHLESSTLSIPSMGRSSIEQTTVRSQGPVYTPLNRQSNPNFFTTTKNNEGSPLSNPYSYATSALASPSLLFSSGHLARGQQRGSVKPVVRRSISTARTGPYSYTSPSLSFSHNPAQRRSSTQFSPSLAPSPPQTQQAPQPSAQSKSSSLKMMNYISHSGPVTRPPPLNTHPQFLSNLDLLNIVLPMSQDEQYMTQWISQASMALPTSSPLDVGYDEQHAMMVPTLGHFLPETSWNVAPSVTSSSAIPYSLPVGDVPVMVPSLVYSPLMRGQSYSTSSVSSLESEVGAPFDLPLSSYPVPAPASAVCGNDGMCATSVPTMSSPFMHPLLISQDMVVSPVLSTCSSYSPSLSDSRYDSDTLFQC
ncbi:Casanova [Mortierella antarctica]|nr:Casanova [Mortierella antarctica]